MASIVDIVNNALNILGASTISSLTEDSKNARISNQRFENVRNRVFRSHPWNCLIKRVQLAQNSNEADGYITSALESKLLRNKFPSKLIFVPGLRMPDDSKDDQVRTATPAFALKNGADAIIMGRSLLSSGDINNNLEKVLNSIK